MPAGRGLAEKWKKRMHRGCVSDAHLDAAAAAQAIGVAAEELFAHPQLQGVRVLCRKHRKHTRHGEVTDCLFIAYAADIAILSDAEPILVERWTSTSVEIGGVKSLATEVAKTELQVHKQPPTHHNLTSRDGIDLTDCLCFQAGGRGHRRLPGVC